MIRDSDHQPDSDYQPPLACPVCGGPLSRHGTTLTCLNRHAFDVAGEGYVNLLAPHHRRRGINGDTLTMIQARRRFLEAGHYEPLLDSLTRLTSALLAETPDESPKTFLESGCGEGYYVGGIAQRLGSPSAVCFLGMDLSKSAVRLAAKRYRDVLFFVGDVHRRIYLQDASIDLLLDVFAPRNAGEFARVVKPGGSVLVVIPSPSHLAEASADLGLLDVEPDKEQRVLEQFSADFTAVRRSELNFRLELSADDARDLLRMGPSSWHAGENVASGPVSTEAAFVLLGFERKG